LTTYNLKQVFSPDSVAVIGASVKKGSAGHTIMENMAAGGFKGEIFPVNPRYDTVMGKKTYSDVSDLPHDIDMAVIATPITSVPKILEACSKKNIGGVVIISDTYSSSRYLADNILSQIIEISRRTNIRVIGPDSVGIVNTSLGLSANIMHRIPLKGKMQAFLMSSVLGPCRMCVLLI